MEYSRLEYSRRPSRPRWKRWLWLPLAVVLMAGYCSWALMRPLPRLEPVQPLATSQVKVPADTLDWPPAGQAALAIPGTPVVETNGVQTALPIASTAKLITVLSILQKKPLAPGQQGPMITLTDRDVALYNSYLAQEGSVVRITAGEQISEYQALQAILLPSANNMADSLAIWAFGSLDAYANYANNYVKQLSMTDTHVGSDASGLAPTTVSTAHDLVKLGEAVMQNPVLSQIVGQETASGLPVVGTVKNVNLLLGANNIVGIKTGNSDQAGGVFVGAARTTVNGKQATIVTAVSGSPTLFQSMKDSLDLIRSAQANFKPVTVVKNGTTVGSYKVPWGGTIPAVVSQDLSLTGWGGGSMPYQTRLNPVAGTAAAGQTAGSVTVQKSGLNDRKSVTVKLKDSAGKPSAWWRLAHPLQ